jgi:hypothetical protein
MPTKLQLLLSIALGFTATLAAAQERYAIAGHGALSCGTYLKAQKEKDDYTPMFVDIWVQGYLSGTNTQSASDHKTKMRLLPEPDSIRAYISKYCNDHPLHSVYQASLSLDSEY